MIALRRILSAVVLVALAGAVFAVVRHGERVRTVAAAPPEAAALRSALVVARGGAAPDGLPALLLVTAPGCGACERARHDLRFLVRPEDLGVRPLVLPASAAGAGLRVVAAPTYFLVDGDDRLLAVTGGYRPPLALRDWMRQELGQPSVRGPGRRSRNAIP